MSGGAGRSITRHFDELNPMTHVFDTLGMDENNMFRQIIDPASVARANVANGRVDDIADITDPGGWLHANPNDPNLDAYAADEAMRNAPLPPLQGSTGAIPGGYAGAGYMPAPINFQSTPTDGRMPSIRERGFARTMGPFSRPNWGVQQVNPAYLTSIQRLSGGKVPQGIGYYQPRGVK